MKRRDWIAAGGIGALAAAGGMAWNLRQGAGPAAPSEVPADDPAGLWSRRFEKPSGGELAMADLRGKPLVLNFWATWCPPCVKEMPELDRPALGGADCFPSGPMPCELRKRVSPPKQPRKSS